MAAALSAAVAVAATELMGAEVVRVRVNPNPNQVLTPNPNPNP